MTATYRNIRLDDAVPASEVVFVVPEGSRLTGARSGTAR
jgi:hypothetical protein